MSDNVIIPKDYTVPSNLLTTSNAKTVKGEKFGYTTYILYMAPGSQNGKGINLCPCSSKGCASACLFKSGRGGFNRVEKARINKSNYFVYNRKGFLEQLDREVTNITKREKHQTKKNIPVFRLNGTADIAFEKYEIRDGKNLFELHPTVQFYDYTKNLKRLYSNNHQNYDLTFSRSEENGDLVKDVLEDGFNVAVVFGVTKDRSLPKTYEGFKVLDGDLTDLRFLDDNGCIVGLKYKYVIYKGSKAMNDFNLTSNSFVI